MNPTGTSPDLIEVVLLDQFPVQPDGPETIRASVEVLDTNRFVRDGTGLDHREATSLGFLTRIGFGIFERSLVAVSQGIETLTIPSPLPADTPLIVDFATIRRGQLAEWDHRLH